MQTNYLVNERYAIACNGYLLHKPIQAIVLNNIEIKIPKIIGNHRRNKISLQLITAALSET
ncbi:MAG: hypothetical protein ACTS78_00375 [Arsenophonus sp. NC-WZS1-MAG3]